MQLELRVQDGATPFLDRVLAEKPQWFGSALKSAGYWAQQEIKKGIRSGAPGGLPYQELIPSWIRRKIDQALGHDTRQNYTPLGKLVNAIGYDKGRVSEGVVTVGWLSTSAVAIGTEQEEGFFNYVSEHMSQAFAAAGYPKEVGAMIEVAARPTYKPMRPIIQTGAPKRVEMKLIQYMQGMSERSAASSNRRYRVYT
jgi:hypothetical protein